MRKLLALALFTAIHFTSAQAQTFEIPPHQQFSPVGSFEIWPESGLPNEFVTHQECEQHAFSRALYNFQLWNEYTRQNELLNACLDANPELDPECRPIQRGELWKPVSESHGTPVILVSSSLQGQTAVVEDASGNSVDTTLRTGCCNNGNRHHVYFRRRCETYPSPAIVRFSGGTCRVIDNPCRRIE